MSLSSSATQQGIIIVWYAHYLDDRRGNTPMLMEKLIHKTYPTS